MSKLSRSDSVTTVTIANGGTTSAAIEARAYAIYGLIFPAALTSTAMTFTVAEKVDGTYTALYDSTGTAVSVTVAASRAFDLPSALASWPYFKIVLGSAEGAARTLYLVAKG